MNGGREVTMGRIALAVCLALAAVAAWPPPAQAQEGLLERAEAVLQASLDRLDGHAAEAAGLLGRGELDGGRAAEVLGWLRVKEPHLITASTVGPEGRLLVVEPRERSGAGADLRTLPGVAHALASAEPTLTALTETVHGFWACGLLMPVFNPSRDFLGLVAGWLHPAPWAEAMLGRVTGAGGRGFILLQKDGLILYHKEHANIGRNLAASARVQADPARRELLRRILADPRGLARGPRLLGRGERVAPVRWVSVGLHETRWRLVLAGPQ
jgi:hypothetical protein